MFPEILLKREHPIAQFAADGQGSMLCHTMLLQMSFRMGHKVTRVAFHRSFVKMNRLEMPGEIRWSQEFSGAQIALELSCVRVNSLHVIHKAIFGGVTGVAHVAEEPVDLFVYI